MKKIKQITNLMLIVLALVFTGCSKDEGGGGGGGKASSGTVTAKIDGAKFTSNKTFTAAQKVNTGASITVTVQGSDNSGKGIVMVMNGFEDGGDYVGKTYNIGGGANISIVASYVEASTAGAKTWQAPFDETVAGTVTIKAADDDHVEGTFEFSARSSEDDSMVEVSNGAFNVDFQ